MTVKRKSPQITHSPKSRPTCQTCKAFEPDGTEGGICRRRSPQVVATPASITGFYPPVKLSGWCLEHVK